MKRLDYIFYIGDIGYEIQTTDLDSREARLQLWVFSHSDDGFPVLVEGMGFIHADSPA